MHSGLGADITLGVSFSIAKGQGKSITFTGAFAGAGLVTESEASIFSEFPPLFRAVGNIPSQASKGKSVCLGCDAGSEQDGQPFALRIFFVKCGYELSLLAF